MKKNYKNIIRLTGRLLIGLLAAAGAVSFAVVPALAQSPVYAEVDRTIVSTGDTLTLSVVVSDPDATRPEIPVLDGFHVREIGKSSQINIINGRVNAQISYQYNLTPTKTGMFTIPPISVIINGQTYSTQPISIEVTQGTAAPAQPPSQPQMGGGLDPFSFLVDEYSGGDVFVEAVVDNPNPYLGQQVNYTFRFYRAVNVFGQPTYQSPSFSGFWKEGDAQQKDFTVTIDQNIYQVMELDSVIFPTSAGEQIIESGVLSLPGSFFSSGIRLQTDPIYVNVLPLLEPTPEGFSGAVGELTITAQVDNEQVTLNEPVTLRVIVSGSGNINTIPEPVLPVMEGWRAFEASTSVDTRIDDSRLVGSKTVEQLYIPIAAGEFQIPAIVYTYFDPHSGGYQTASTEPITVQVAPGASGVIIPPVSISGEPVDPQAGDIRHIKSVPERINTAEQPLHASPAFWALFLIPIGAFSIDVFWGRRQRVLLQNPALARSSQAQKRALRSLAQARKDGSDPYHASGQALKGYLSDRFNQPVAGMTQTELVKFLENKGLLASITGQVSDILVRSEMGRYAPADTNEPSPSELLNHTEKLISRVEKGLSQ